jgi:hypothetical protein
LDTRIATVAKYDPTLASDLLEKGLWHNRNSNKLPNQAQGFFDNLYKNRDVETLKLSYATNVVKLLIDLTARYRGTENERITGQSVKLTINTYPYKLTAEQKQVYCESFSSLLGFGEVVTVSLANDFLPPSTLLRYDTAILSDLDGWLSMWVDRIAGNKPTGCYLYAPLIAINRPPELKNLTDENIADINSKYMSSMFNLRLLPLGIFSVVTPEKKDSPSPNP